MSLWRVGQRASRFATTFRRIQFHREFSTEGSKIPEKQMEENSKLGSGEITIQPVRDVMVADVISGAPGASIPM